jgi:hypothetical protein
MRLRTLSTQGIRKSADQGLRKSADQGIRKSADQGLRKSADQGIRKYRTDIKIPLRAIIHYSLFYTYLKSIFTPSGSFYFS